MHACRDCEVCTRLGIVSLLLLPFKLIYTILFRWNIGLILHLFIRYCPECGHWLSQHKKRADGSFTD